MRRNGESVGGESYRSQLVRRISFFSYWFWHLSYLVQSELQSALQAAQTWFLSFTVDSSEDFFFFLFK